MFQQQFYLDCGYFDGMVGTLPRWQLYGMGALLNGSEHQLDPSPQEIRELLSVLGVEFPAGRTAAIVTKLYRQVVLLEIGKGRLKELGESCEIIACSDNFPTAPTPVLNGLLQQLQSVDRNIDLAYNLTTGNTIELYNCEPVLREGEGSEQRRREERRRAIALALSEEAFGHHSFIESQRRLGRRDLINKSKYAILARSVVADTFRRMEQHLQVSIEIVPLTKDELSLTLQYLLRCKTMMPGEDSLAFLSAVRMAFRLPHSPVLQTAVAKVYLAVQCHVKKQLQRRAIKQQYGQLNTSQQKGGEQRAVDGLVELRRRGRAGKKGKESQRGLDNVWDQRMEQQLIASFKRDCDYGSIRDHFQQTFPHHKNLLSVISLKKQLHKLIRLALRRLKGVLAAMGKDAPQMLTMTDKRTKYLMLVESNELVGKELMHLYTEDFTMQQLEKTVAAINAYVAKKDAEFQMRKKFEFEEEEEAKIDEDSEPYESSQISANQHQEEFKRAKVVLEGIGYKSITRRSTGRDPKEERFTSHTWEQKIEQDSQSEQ